MANWDRTFLDITKLIANHSKCIKVQVGSVLVKDTRIISMGYNGTISGQPNCNEKFDPNDFIFGMRVQEKIDDHYKFQKINEVHAEINAILYAAKHGIPTEGATLYCNLSPCNDCCKTIAAAGIKKVIYEKRYEKETEGLELLSKCGIEVIQFKGE